MKYIKVRAVAGRVARTARDGEFIPHDRYVRVDYTPYIARLLNVHGDIEVEPETTPAAEVAADAAPALPKEKK